MLVKAGKEGVHQENRQKDGKNENTQSQNMPSQRTSAPKANAWHYKVNPPITAVHIKLYLGILTVVVIQVIMDCVITLGTGDFFFLDVLFVKMVLLTFCHFQH